VATKHNDGRHSGFFCQTPNSVVGKAFGCEPLQLRLAADMFPESWIESEFLNEFYIMDIILNRAPSPEVTGKYRERGTKNHGGSPDVNCDVVRPVVSYKPEDLGAEKDFLYRTAILFLPQCGVFYCQRERRRGDTGVPGTFTAHSMSWLRLQREVHRGVVSYTFGDDSFVKRFVSECEGEPVDLGAPRARDTRMYLTKNHRVSAWRISAGYRHCSLQNRVVYRAIQCPDADGPMLPPQFILCQDERAIPLDYRAAQYRELLFGSNSAKKDGRHYVEGCLHYELPPTCWIINTKKNHFVDIILEIDTSNVVGGTRTRESVVMIRNVMGMDAHDDHLDLLERLVRICTEIRKSGAKGYARSDRKDVGAMFAIGTKIPYKKEAGMEDYDTAPYAANAYVSEGLLRNLVVTLATLGSCCLP
jgi:hypothetical protein